MTLFKCFLFKSAFEHGDFSPFLKLALYKCNIIISLLLYKYQVKLDALHSAPTYLCNHLLAVILLDR